MGKGAAVQSSELYKRVVDMGIHSLQQIVLDRHKSSTSFGRFCPDGSLDVPRKQHRRGEEKIRNSFKKWGKGLFRGSSYSREITFNGCEASQAVPARPSSKRSR